MSTTWVGAKQLLRCVSFGVPSSGGVGLVAVHDDSLKRREATEEPRELGLLRSQVRKLEKQRTGIEERNALLVQQLSAVNHTGNGPAVSVASQMRRCNTRACGQIEHVTGNRVFRAEFAINFGVLGRRCGYGGPSLGHGPWATDSSAGADRRVPSGLKTLSTMPRLNWPERDGCSATRWAWWQGPGYSLTVVRSGGGYAV